MNERPTHPEASGLTQNEVGHKNTLILNFSKQNPHCPFPVSRGN